MDITAVRASQMPAPVKEAVAYSPNATVRNIRVWDHWEVLQAVPSLVTETMQTPRPPQVPGDQEMFAVNKSHCMELLQWGPGSCQEAGVYVVSFAYAVPVVVGVIRKGGYLTTYEDSYLSADEFLEEECVQKKGLSQCYSDHVTEHAGYHRGRSSSGHTQVNVSAIVGSCVAAGEGIQTSLCSLHAKPAGHVCNSLLQVIHKSGSRFVVAWQRVLIKFIYVSCCTWTLQSACMLGNPTRNNDDLVVQGSCFSTDVCSMQSHSVWTVNIGQASHPAILHKGIVCCQASA